MHWFHAQSIAKFHGTGKVIDRIRNITGDRPAKGDPNNKKTYRPKKPWRQLVKDQTKTKIDRGASRGEQSYVSREDWGDIWPSKLLLAMAYKFDQYEKLQKLLLETGSAIIVYDIADDSFGATNIEGQVVGDNAVGQALMRIREQIALRVELGIDKPLVEYPNSRKEPEPEPEPEYDYHDIQVSKSIFDPDFKMSDLEPEFSEGLKPTFSEGLKIEDCSEELQKEFAQWLENQGETQEAI